MTGSRRRFALLALIVIAGTALRFHALTGRTLRQGEIFVPGISLPDSVSDPHSMLTLKQVVTGTTWDVHPPTWYLGMWFWTKAAGTSLYAIRFPSALFGSLAILLTYWVASSDREDLTGFIAAALVAFNGLHILWSQVARQYTFACVIGLISTGLLVRAVRGGARRQLWAWLYATITLLGLATLYYFWPLFLTQILWALVEHWRTRSREQLLRLQALVLTLATPIITIAAFQSKESYLDAGTFRFFADYAALSFLFEADDVLAAPLSPPLIGALTVLGALLLAIGLVHLGTTQEAAPDVDVEPLPTWVLVGGAALATLVILAESVVLGSAMPHKRPMLLATAVLPGLVMVATSGPLRLTRGVPRHGTSLSLVGLLSIVPILIVAGVSLSVPFYASKGMLIYLPYFGIVVAAGVTGIARSSRAGAVAAGALLLILAAAHVQSVRYQAARPGSAQDYRGLAMLWRRELHAGDMVFSVRHWESTPTYFYLDLSQNAFVGRDFAAAIARAHPDRVWVYLPTSMPVPQAMTAALVDFQPSNEVAVSHLHAMLFQRRSKN